MRQPIYTIAYNFPLPATPKLQVFRYFHSVGRADVKICLYTGGNSRDKRKNRKIEKTSVRLGRL